MADRRILRFCLKFHLFPGFGMRKRKRIGKKRNIFDPKLLRALHRRLRSVLLISQYRKSRMRKLRP